MMSDKEIQEIDFNDKADLSLREIFKETKRFPNLSREEYAKMVILRLKSKLFNE